jgi:hypothetical protein
LLQAHVPMCPSRKARRSYENRIVSETYILISLERLPSSGGRGPHSKLS